MSKGLKRLATLAVAAAGAYAVGKYLHDYTDYKLAEKDDLDELKKGGERAKEAAKRTYIALKNGSDVNAPAGELGTAVAEMAGGAGKIVNAVGENTKQFALNEKEKYHMDPEGYKAKVAENLKDLGQQAAGVFNGLKEGAEGIITDIKESAENLRYDQDDFVSSSDIDRQEQTDAKDSFMEVKEEPLYTEEPEKLYAEITPAEGKTEINAEAKAEVKAEVKAEEVREELKEAAKEKGKTKAKAAAKAKESAIVVSDDTEEIKQ